MIGWTLPNIAISIHFLHVQAAVVMFFWNRHIDISCTDALSILSAKIWAPKPVTTSCINFSGGIIFGFAHVRPTEVGAEVLHWFGSWFAGHFTWWPEFQLGSVKLWVPWSRDFLVPRWVMPCLASVVSWWLCSVNAVKDTHTAMTGDSSCWAAMALRPS